MTFPVTFPYIFGQNQSGSIGSGLPICGFWADVYVGAPAAEASMAMSEITVALMSTPTVTIV